MTIDDNQQDQQDEMLDALYAGLVKEIPPESIDEAILAQARQELTQGAHQSLFQWQRVVSVAAVMVLSVSLFFNTDSFRDASDKLNLFHTPESIPASAPASSVSEEQGVSALSGSAQPSVSLKTKKELSNDAASLEKDLHLSQSEEGIGAQLAKQKALTLESKAMSAKQRSTQQRMPVAELSVVEDEISDSNEASADLALSEQYVNGPLPRMKRALVAQDVADKMADQIIALIKEGELEEAKVRYDALRLRYPNYPLPEKIQTHFRD